MPAALLVAAAVVGAAVVQAFAARDPGKAAAIWPDHPTILLESGLSQVGETAAAGRPVDRALVDRLVSAFAKAPLAPQPFLVRGVEAQVAGDRALAERAYLAARQRDPRGVAPRYFLADLYLKSGRADLGLTEIGALARLVPQSLPGVAPYLAAYARTPSASPKVKRMLESHPQLEQVLLSELANDPDNAELIISLWSGRGGEEARPWQGRLLNQLVEAGRFNEARVVWARFTGISAERDQLFDPEFLATALPPFGWTLTSGASGIAEPEAGGRLHALYYGRDDLTLAAQLMTLPPGRYRLSMDIAKVTPESKSLSWTVHCLPASRRIASVRLDRSGPVEALLAIPSAGCPAQRLELSGRASEFPDRADIRISRLRLQRASAR